MATGTILIPHSYHSDTSDGNWKWIEFDNGAIMAWGSVNVSTIINSGPYNRSGFYYSDTNSIKLPFTLSSGAGALSSNNITMATNFTLGSAGNSVAVRLVGASKQTSTETYQLKILVMGIKA